MIWRKETYRTTDFFTDEEEQSEIEYMNTVIMTSYYLFGIKVASSYFDDFDKSILRSLEEDSAVKEEVKIGFTTKKKE